MANPAVKNDSPMAAFPAARIRFGSNQPPYLTK